MLYFAKAVIYFWVTSSYNYDIIDNRNETTAKRGVRMNPKLRIMTIRLMEKMAEHPGYAARIGIDGCMTQNHPDQSERSK